MTEDEARAAVDGLRLRDRDRARRASDGSTPGDVLETDPRPASELDEGGTLVLFVSLGNTPAPVPTDLVGHAVRPRPMHALDDGGGFTSEVDRGRVPRRSPAGRVISLGPDVPAELPKGTTVAARRLEGPEPRTIPDGLDGQDLRATRWRRSRPCS